MLLPTMSDYVGPTVKLASFEQADLNNFELTIISWYWDVAYTYMHVYTPNLTCTRTAEYEIISIIIACSPMHRFRLILVTF
jgi:hypothetical protein